MNKTHKDDKKDTKGASKKANQEKHKMTKNNNKVADRRSEQDEKTADKFCTKLLLDGCQLKKVNEKRGKLKHLQSLGNGEAILFWADAEMRELKFKYKEKKSKPFTIRFSAIVNVFVENKQQQQQKKEEKANEEKSGEAASSYIRILYGKPSKQLLLLADTPTVADMFCEGLRLLLACTHDITGHKQQSNSNNNGSTSQQHQTVKVTALSKEERIRLMFDRADKNRDGRLDMDEILQLLRKLNVRSSRTEIKQTLKEITSHQDGGCLDYSAFMSFYRKVAVRPELMKLMEEVGHGDDCLTPATFETFLQQFQHKDNVTEAECTKIISQHETDSRLREQQKLGIDGFTSYLLSEECDAVNKEAMKLDEKSLCRPLSHYFINSSHNTYLVGHQIAGNSSTEAYVSALNSGCRCVELDCWDGCNGEPIIYHGYTLTSKIPFRDVIETINTHAFANNPYPVVLSIENHCSLPQQQRMAETMKRIFGDKLDVASSPKDRLPSPDDLKNKILIKCQKLSENFDHCKLQEEIVDENEVEYRDHYPSKRHYSSDFTGSSVKRKNQSLVKFMGRKSSYKHSPPTSTTSMRMKRRSNNGGNGGGGGEDDIFDEKSQVNQCRVLSRHLSDLVIYTRSSRFPGFDAIDKSGFDVWSFSESRAQHLIESRPYDVLKANRQRFMRVYPGSLRVSSSNFNPVFFWNAGCQMVALNHQTKDRAMQLNESLFELNGGCGYVLKPHSLLSDDEFNPLKANQPLNSMVTQLTVTVISAQELPKPANSVLGERGEIIDPFVEVEIEGTSSDSTKKQTSVIDDNGFNPIWNETFVFDLHSPQLAFIRFVVWDSDPIGRDYIGQRTLSVQTLNEGYRHLKLKDTEDASLFVRISLKTCRRSQVTKKMSKLDKLQHRMKSSKKLFDPKSKSMRSSKNSHHHHHHHRNSSSECTSSASVGVEVGDQRETRSQSCMNDTEVIEFSQKHNDLKRSKTSRSRDHHRHRSDFWLNDRPSISGCDHDEEDEEEEEEEISVASSNGDESSSQKTDATASPCGTSGQIDERSALSSSSCQA